jgi:hypothetical protein
LLLLLLLLLPGRCLSWDLPLAAVAPAAAAADDNYVEADVSLLLHAVLVCHVRGAADLCQLQHLGGAYALACAAAALLYNFPEIGLGPALGGKARLKLPPLKMDPHTKDQAR